MNPLVAKEIRLMLPSCLLALVLAVAPIWLFQNPYGRLEQALYTALPLFCFGTLMMALTSFGREFGMGTFPLLLALPLSRARIWWVKITVLACALALVFSAGMVSWWFWNGHGLYLRDMQDGQPLNVFSIIGGRPAFVFICVVIFASGLWTTLLLRQIMAAFWFAVLVPAAILTVIIWNGGTHRAVEVTLAIYSVAGFCWAWRQFYRAQEVGWVASEVTLPEWGSANAGVRQTSRTHRPFAALLWKEVQLYQVALIGMVGLFALHLVVIMVRRTLHGGPEGSVLSLLLAMFSGIWVIVPLITGSLNVADERRLGTLESQLCLPISTRKQFTVKLLVVLLLSGFLSGFLLWLAEGIGGVLGTVGWLGAIKMYLNGDGLLPVSVIFIAISLLIFYASTLTRSILQAIMVAMLTVGGFVVAWGLAEILWRSFNPRFWGGPLLTFITVPTLIVTLIWLAYGNYRRLGETRKFWLRNSGGIVLAVLFSCSLGSLIFSRAWEFLTPMEPRHGVAQLRINQSPVLRAGYAAVSVLLPDGRLWWERPAFDPGRVIHLGKKIQFSLTDGKWVAQKGNYFLDESNWVDSANTYSEAAGIQSDGSLWASERMSMPPRVRNGKVGTQAPVKMLKVGEDNNWKRVVWAGNRSGLNMMLLLKTDGTLWAWGTNDTRRFHQLSQIKPTQVGTDADWSDIIATPPGSFVWKSDGRAWLFDPRRQMPAGSTAAQTLLQRWESFDSFRWRSVAMLNGPLQFAVRDDGTLWNLQGKVLANYRQLNDASQFTPIQIGTASDWVAVACNNNRMIALKADGTLWQWDAQWGVRLDSMVLKPPTRLGTHSDWVAISGSNGFLSALAADGSLWSWASWDSAYWLAPSRKPTKLAEVLARQ